MGVTIEKMKNRDISDEYYFFIIWLLLFITNLFFLFFSVAGIMDNFFNAVSYSRQQRQIFLFELTIFFILLISGVMYIIKIRPVFQKKEEDNILKAIEEKQLYGMLLQQKHMEVYDNQQVFNECLNKIYDLVQNGNVKEASNYVSTLIDIDKEIANKKITGNSVMDMLLNKTAQNAQNKHIKFTIDYQPNVRLHHLETQDFYLLMSNVLENALSAAENSQEKWVDCEFCRRNNYMDLIVVRNSCDKEPQFYNGGLCSKKSNLEHGYGTKIIRKKIEKYGGDYIFSYNDKEKIFSIRIILPVQSVKSNEK